MSARLSRPIALAAFALIAGAAGPARAGVVNQPWTPRPDVVATLVAPLDGDKNLSLPVSTIFDFQVWDTLSPDLQPDVISFILGWNQTWPPPKDTASALELTRKTSGQLILWGHVQRFGDSVIALPRLSVAGLDADRRTTRPEIWTVGSGTHAVALDVPRMTYDLGVVRLNPAFVAGYSSPTALKLCDRKEGVCNGPPVGLHFTMHSREGSWVSVTTKDGAVVRGGWVRIPEMSDVPPIVGSFVGGMIAYFRGDFAKARQDLGAAADSDALGPEETTYALALALAATARSGADTTSLRARLLEADPYSPYVAKVLVMDRLEAASHMTDASAHDAALASAESLLGARPDLQETDRDWFAAAQAAVNQRRATR